MFVKTSWISSMLQHLHCVQSLSIFALADCLIAGNCTALSMNLKTNYQILHSLNPMEKHLNVMTAGKAALNYTPPRMQKMVLTRSHKQTPHIFSCCNFKEQY